MSRTVLMILGIVIVAMGILAVFKVMPSVVEPMWHAWAKIVVGVLAIVIAASDTRKA